MEVEHDIKSFPIDANLQTEVEKLTKAGWMLAPGTAPLAVYHLVRVKNTPGEAIGVMAIDDSKIMVIPAGRKN